ncbi:MAG: glutamate--tRNA ligase [Bacteroidetes bacterium RIFOXYA12_FULL_35_11]|nr:MAG: glutamate--tRNA ligase [Bacteroidetes bacterium GWF2_35_48]OFY72958.1 MAG: glutamate--tRNA ligase [Bacteroidetes bacterium RIFOXYA12_FULL_35_11]OFY97788.1 MAG: glutamate--tRNA ligase [Bacteroidetes bacterium RIFOXYB2_FULL_35_7]HBX53126.1 glutamate--tRNA ligase [Bacteroidales bacterium]
MSEKKVRVRFAPSPTGPLHIGGVRTALYNYLFAKKHGGDFILRIEDTDQTRFVPGAEEYIVEALAWVGLKFDEGVHVGGPHAPYRQSERRIVYRQFADRLIENNHAYFAFDTPEELENIKKQHEANKQPFQYGPATRMQMKNSLTLSKDEVAQKIAAGEPYVIRIKIPENEEIIVHDLIRGIVKVQSALLDDKVLFKSDGLPTYHLANVVDDFLMQISHVIRGEEWLPSAPLHVLLYRYLGIENDMPQFAHLPLLLKPDGNGKLSKRDGDRLGFPVFPLQWEDPSSKEISSGYRESGYISEAVVNLLAFLGWNPGTEQELFSMEELIQSFSLERVSKAGAKFDLEKAKWFNHQYLSKKSNAELLEIFKPMFIIKGICSTDDYIECVIGLVKERMIFITDFWEKSSFFFIAPESFDEKSVKDKWKDNSPALLTELAAVFASMPEFTAEKAHDAANIFVQEKQIGMGQAMNALRVAIVGAATGPDMFTMLALLGKEETVRRIDFAVKNVKK